MINPATIQLNTYEVIINLIELFFSWSKSSFSSNIFQSRCWTWHSSAPACFVMLSILMLVLFTMVLWFIKQPYTRKWGGEHFMSGIEWRLLSYNSRRATLNHHQQLNNSQISNLWLGNILQKFERKKVKERYRLHLINKIDSGRTISHSQWSVNHQNN